MNLAADPQVPFHALFVRGTRSKTEQRRFVATNALTWLKVQKKLGRTGAIMVDIDDTLIDGNESVAHGFQFMHLLYEEASLLFPIHIVTARPDDDHSNVMGLLKKKGFCIPPDRLHMLPANEYGKSLDHVERFKWNAFQKIRHLHGKVVARFGDKLWDVAHLDALHTYLSHIHDRDCYIFMDPNLGHVYSAKLPGA